MFYSRVSDKSYVDESRVWRIQLHPGIHHFHDEFETITHYVV